MVSIGIIFKIDLENFERKYHFNSNGFNFLAVKCGEQLVIRHNYSLKA